MDATSDIFSGSQTNFELNLENTENNPSCCSKFLNLVIQTVAAAAISAACGAIVGFIVGAPLALTAGVYAVSGAVKALSESVVDSLGEAYNLKQSTVTLLKVIPAALIAIAFLSATFSFGIFGITGVSILGGLSVLGLCLRLSQASTQIAEGL